MIARVNEEQVSRLAAFFAAASDVKPFRFCVPGLYPPEGAPGVIDYFVFCTAHQFGFWYEEGGRYARPMIATRGGKALKGSDYLSTCATRLWEKEPDAFSPAAVRRRSDRDWASVFADDSGCNPLPMWAEHLAIIRGYADWFHVGGVEPTDLVETANQSATPLAAFLAMAGRIPGYREDPLQKKLQLLAVMLENRPERFLRVTDPEAYRPIIDYHLQRSALRTGLVEITDPVVRSAVAARCRVGPEVESGIRRATFDAVAELGNRSGASVAAIDYFFFTNRTRCPEMSTPDCPSCPLREVCARQTDLFQPVLRTTAY